MKKIVDFLTAVFVIIATIIVTGFMVYGFLQLDEDDKDTLVNIILLD